MNASTRIDHHMTPSAHTIGFDQTLETARARMTQLGIRHLPVLHSGRLVGVITLRDIDAVETLADVDPQETRVEDAMVAEAYVVEPVALVADVVEEMAARRIDSAIVAKSDRVLGIFTAVDALRLLADRLRAS